MEINSIESHTQSQFEFLRFTALQHVPTRTDKLIENRKSNLLDQCLPHIDRDPETNQFSNRAAQALNKAGDMRSGILLGQGDIEKFSSETLDILCTVLTSASANSEMVRLVKPHPTLPALYYFVAKEADFMFLFDRAYSEVTASEYFTPEVKRQYESFGNQYTGLWVTNPYSDGITNKQTITFVQNIKNYRSQTVGFLARDLYLSDLVEMIDNSLSQRNTHIHLMQYGKLDILNDDRVLLSHTSKGMDLSGQTLLNFESVNLEQNQSGFGHLSVRLSVPFIAMAHLVLDEQPYLFFMPLFVFLFSYTILQQMLRGIRESDKQYFDSLTQVYNRHGLYQRVYKKIDKAIANDKDAHIFSIDANKFKQINDKYGHDTGDKAIALIANAAKHICQPHDDIVRLGGDEFLIVLYINAKNEFDPQQFMIRLNQKLAYDCKASSIPVFSVSGGYVLFSAQTKQSLPQAIKEADSILMSKKSVDKIDTICHEFDSFDINLSEDEQGIKLQIVDKLNFVEAEHLLQSELNEAVLSAYHGKLNYLISNYFKMIYSCTRENDNLHNYRLKIAESHYNAGIPMSVFYFLFIKYGNFLFRDVEINHDEFVINNRLHSYELHFMSSLKG
ncbi:MAG: GGDEF domain-containing protein [Vibrio litoralis]|uniref:GGDEF domain-containing protein n=1 Tax=Vibrio litoralis TaxID=335972 RepID=UPI003F9C99A6